MHKKGYLSYHIRQIFFYGGCKMEHRILFRQEARERLLEGARLLKESVKGTLGPCGHHAVIQKEYGLPLVSNDGVTIAKALHCDDPYAQMGIQIMLDSANKTNETSGDGTTTSILLAYEMLARGYRAMEQGCVAKAFVSGMEQAADQIEKYIHEQAKMAVSHDKIAQIASISAKSKRIGSLIADALKAVHDPRCIVCEQGRSYESRLRIQEGTELSASLLSPYFLANDETSCVRKHPCLFISNAHIASLSQIEHFLAYTISVHRPLIIICEDMESDVLAQLIVWNMQKKGQICVCKAPSFGSYQADMLEDLALLCKGKACIADMGRELTDIPYTELGEAKEAIIHKHSLQIFVNRHEPIQKRIAWLKEQLPKQKRQYDTDHVYRRIAALEGKLAVLEIGGYTKGEIEEKRMRCEDALQASFAAMEEGIVCGGGLALLQCYRNLHQTDSGENKDVQAGMDCVYQAILRPFLQLMENNDENPSEMLQKQLELECTVGYDVWKEEWCDLYEKGIVDPAKVVIQSLHNAVSVAGLLIKCDVAMLSKAINP